MKWINEICRVARPLFSTHIYLLLLIIILSLFISISLQSNTDYDESINMKLADNIFRVLAGAAAGGLLTILVLNHTARVRVEHSSLAIIQRLVELSGAAYVDILGNYGRGDFINSLYGSIFGPSDGSDRIREVIDLLSEKARRFERGELPYGLYKYDRTIKYVEDLTNIYYRDAINNTNDRLMLKELYHCTNVGLKLLGLLQGDFTESSRLWTLAHFLEVNLKLYRILLGNFGVVIEDNRIVIGARA